MKKHVVKRFDQWVYESQTNEGFKDTMTSIGKKIKETAGKVFSKIPGLKWIGNRFSGNKSWLLNQYLLSKTPEGKGIEIYLNDKNAEEAVREIERENSNIGNPYKNSPKIEAESTFKSKEVVTPEGEISEAINLKHYQAEQETGTPNVTMAEMVDILEDKMYSTRRLSKQELPNPDLFPSVLFVWGAMSTGKTQSITKLTKKIEEHNKEIKNNITTKSSCKVINMAMIDPDFWSLPYLKETEISYKKGDGNTTEDEMVKAKTKTAGFAVTDRFPLVPDDVDMETRKRIEAELDPPNGDIGIILFDELSALQDKRVITGLLSLIADRKIFDYSIHKKWMIVCAGNREKDRPDTGAINDVLLADSTFLSRFEHVNVVPTEEEVLNYWRTKYDVAGSEKELTEEEVFKEWLPVFYPEILDFLSMSERGGGDEGSGYIHAFGNTEISGTINFPSSRSWTHVAKSIRDKEGRIKEETGVERRLTIDEIINIVNRGPGTFIATKLKEYLLVAMSVNPKDFVNVYDNPKKAPKWDDKMSLSKKRAWISAMIRVYAEKKLTPEQILNFANYISNIKDISIVELCSQKFVQTHGYWIPERVKEYDNSYSPDLSSEYVEIITAKQPNFNAVGAFRDIQTANR